MALSLLMLGPLLGPGYWLWADAVSVPRSYLVDQALGLAEPAPRATPQDAALAMLSSALDGGLVVKAATVLALFAAGTGAARLARFFLPACGMGAQMVAAAFAVNNLWVVERLLQGQWSLLLGYGALGHGAVLAAELRAQISARGWAELGFWLAAGGLVPTGALLVALLAGTVLVAPGGTRWWARTACLAGLTLAAAAPWAAAGLFGLSRGELGSGGAAGVEAFAAQPDRAGWLALGGIWNAQSVPASQLGWFGLAANTALVALVAAGAFLLRRRLRREPVLGLLFGLGLVAVLLVGLSQTALAQEALAAAMARFPSLGVLRDGQKWAALAWPAYALSLARLAGVQPEPRCFRAPLRAGLVGGSPVSRAGACSPPRPSAVRCIRLGLPIAMLVLLLLFIPDGLWGAGGRLAPVRYPQAWFQVRSAVAEDPGSGALLTVPVGITRRYGWAQGRGSIDPAPRLLPVPVAQSGDLLVGPVAVPGEGALARRAAEDLLAGASPQRLAEDSVGWALVERDQIGALPAAAQRSLAQFEPVLDAQGFELYRNPVAPWPVPTASGSRRRVVLLAHLLWAGLLAVGAGGALGRPFGRWRAARSR